MSRLGYDVEVTMLLQSNLIEQESSLEALRDAIEAWDFLSSRRLLTHAVVLHTHALLMDSRPSISDKYKGAYRDVPVYIGGRTAPLALTIRPSLDRLFDKLNDRRNIPVSDGARAMHARRLHVEFEHIHPFIDGNGRIGRMIYNWHRLRLGLEVQVILESEKYEYYQWFAEPLNGGVK